MEGTGVLGYDIQFPPQGAKRATIDAVAVGGTHYVRSCLVDSAVDHKGCCVQQPDVSTVNDLAIVVHLYQIALPNQRESHPKRVHPESGRIDRIAQRDVSRHPLVEAVFAEDSEGGSKFAFQVVALCVFVREFCGAGEFGHLHFGLGFGETGFVGCAGGGEVVAVGLGGWGCCGGGCHCGVGAVFSEFQEINIAWVSCLRG